MFREFKEFALRGNLVDLAVAFVMGAAFTRLTTAFIDDLVMPLVGALTPGSLDFTDKYYPLTANIPAGVPLEEARKAGAVLAYGDFISVALNFLIVAFAMFLVVKAINKAKKFRESPAPVPAPVEIPPQEKILMEIRDLLKERR